MRQRLPVASFLLALLVSACGDDPVVPPAPPKNEAGAGGAEVGGNAGEGGSGGLGGETAGAGGVQVGGQGGSTAGQGGAAAGTSSGGGGATAVTPAASGPVHGSLRDLGGGKMGLRLGDFPFACAEHPDDAACGATNRALVLAEVTAGDIAVGAPPLALTGQAVATSAAPACGKGAAPFSATLTVVAFDATSAKIKLSGSTAAGFDGEHTLGRCTQAVAPGNALAFRTAAGVRIEAADYALSCAVAPTPPPCGDRFRLDFTLPTVSTKGAQVALATTTNPVFTSTSAETTGCKTDSGPLTGQMEIVDVLGDRLRLRALGTNVFDANKTVFDALFCD